MAGKTAVIFNVADLIQQLAGRHKRTAKAMAVLKASRSCQRQINLKLKTDSMVHTFPTLIVIIATQGCYHT
jgi:hypothetical protein